MKRRMAVRGRIRVDSLQHQSTHFTREAFSSVAKKKKRKAFYEFYSIWASLSFALSVVNVSGP